MGKKRSKKIRPRYICSDTYDVITGRGYVKGGEIYNLLRKPYSVINRKDNNRWGLVLNNGDSYKQKIRFPSLKRSMKVWKNFYMLFPLVYIEMRNQIEGRGLKNGDVVEIVLNELPGYYRSSDEINDKQKVRVVDLGGLEMVHHRVKHCVYWKIDQNEHDRMVEDGDLIKVDVPQR